MLESIPAYINISFILITIATVWLFYKATRNNPMVAWVLGLWLIFQGYVGYSEFYTMTEGMPPRFTALIGVPLLAILGLFLTKRGRIFLEKLNPKFLTYLHTVRVPVELVLWGLFIYGAIPELMTFEGRNFDILAGLTAPFVAYLGYQQMKLSKSTLLIWNLVSLGLLLNIVINAVLAAPFAFQQQAFDQPNIGVLYFPFVWLPGCVVPLVLLSHLVSIRQLIRKEKHV